MIPPDPDPPLPVESPELALPGNFAALRENEPDTEPLTATSATKLNPRLRKRMSRTLQVILLIFVLDNFVLPQLTGAKKALRAASSLQPSLLLLGLALEVISLLCYSKLTREALAPSKLKTRTIARIQLATKALTNVVPGGSAAGPALGFRLLVLGGEDRSVAGFALALVGLGSAVVLNLILWFTLVLSIPFSGVRPGYVTAALVGMFLLLALFVLVAMALRGTERASKMVGQLAAKVRFIDANKASDFVVRFAERARSVLQKPQLLRRLVVWASLNWLLDAASLWVFLKAFGVTMRPDAVLVAFCIANITGAVPITPGGLGVFEAALGSTLGLFGAPFAKGALAISAYRLAAYWLPIPAGGLCYLSLRAGPLSLNRMALLRPLREEAETMLESGETIDDWADRVAVPRVAAAAAAAAASGEVVILADRAQPGTVRKGSVAPPPNAPKPRS